jgi:probable F420-dependent oxidoreductase
MRFHAPFRWGNPTTTAETLIREAQTAERSGFWSVAAGEHLLYPQVIDESARYSSGHHALSFDPAVTPHFEQFACLTVVASHTTTLRLRTAMTVIPYRSPFQTAKQAATLDVLSGGRFVLGAATGWMAEEFALLKVPHNRRGAITSEYLEAIRALFAGQPFRGEHYQFEDVVFLPKPVQEPLPIWVGGNVDAALRRAARYGNGWDPRYPDPADFADRRRVLVQLLEEAGRGDEPFDFVGGISIDFGDDVGPSTRIAVRNDADALLEAIAAWSEAGATSLTIRVGNHHTMECEPSLERMQWFGEEVIPRAAGL